jgi:uncharacterized protein (TIRG00374 family)
LLNKSKRYILLLLKCGLTSGILFYIFTIIPLDDVIRSLSEANLYYVLTAPFIAILSTVLSAYRLKILTDKQGMSLPVTKIVEINFVTSFYGLLVPGFLSSGVIRWHKMATVDKKKTEAFAAIAFGRIYYTIIVVVLAIVFLALDISYGLQKLSILIFLGLLSGLLIIYFIGFSPKILIILDKLYHGREKIIPYSVYNWIKNIFISTIKYHSLSLRSWSSIIALALMENLLGAMMVYLLAMAMNINISFINIGWIRSVIIIFTTLPISFSGVGLREGGFIVLLGTYGVPGEDALSLSFLVFATVLFLAGIGGLIEAIKFLFVYKYRNNSGIG